MRELGELRLEIDAIDREMLRLFLARARLVLEVGAYKRARGLPVYDATRERAILDNLCALAEPPVDIATVRRFFERIIDESRAIEQRAAQPRADASMEGVPAPAVLHLGDVDLAALKRT